MSASDAPRRRLPAKPSQENLRKQAKRLARSEALQLAAAQHRLAGEYGFPNWAALMAAANPTAAAQEASVLAAAAARADVDAVRRLLSEGESADGGGEAHPPLWRVCDSDVPADRRIAVADLLLQAGASPRRACKDNATALHAAARRGPLALVELLIRRGALSWQGDRRGRIALDYARKGTAADRDAIVELLDRPVMRDPLFRAAVAAIHAGDLDGLNRLLDQHPRLLRERAIEPDCYPLVYFTNPKLFWFIANNPTLMRTVPANIIDIGRTMIARGVEQADLDYTLELAMSSGATGVSGQLVTLLVEAGATVTPHAVAITLAHLVYEPVEMLLGRGLEMTLPIAAALGRNAEVRKLLEGAAQEDVQMAFGLAVINRRVEAARLCLAAGADCNAFLPVHKHSTPLHQAAIHDDIDMLKLLVAHGARLSTRDTLWDGTPLGWAVHNNRTRAEAYLRSLQEK